MKYQLNGRLADRVAVVTGGAGELGSATVRRFVEEGARVALWDLRSSECGASFEDVRESVLLIDVDVSNPDEVDEAVSRTREQLGSVQVLVNNAGVAEPKDPWDVDNESWRRMMSINADSQFWCIRALLPDMRRAQYGKIINISSLAALNPRKSTHPAYAASKAAVIGLMSSLIRSVGPYGICINTVLPGFIRTSIHDSYTDEQLAAITADIPLSREGRPVDVANACVYLASAESDYVSGALLNLNGGTSVGT